MTFLRESFKVLLGTLGQRFMMLVMVPVIARLLGPKDYGIFSVAKSVCNIVAICSSFSLEASIAVAATEEEAALRTIGTFGVGMLSGILFSFIVYLICPYLENYYSINMIHALLFMIPIFVPLTIMGISIQNYVGYLGKFKFFAVADIISSFIRGATLIFVYFLFWKDYRCLIISEIIALFIRIVIFLYASKGSELFHKKTLSTKVFKSLWQVRNFAKFNLPANLLNTATVQLPPILLSLNFSEKIVGLFTMARNIISLPTELSGKSLGQVFYPKAAEEYRSTGSLTKITWQTFVYSCQLTLFPCIFTVAGSFLLPILFGPRWVGVIPFLFLLLPMALLNSVQTQIGIGFIFSIMNQQFKILIGNIILFLFRILPLFICILLGTSVYLTILLYSLGGAVGYGLLLVWIFTTTSISIKQAFYTWIKYCFIDILCVSPVLGVYLLTKQTLLVILSLGISFMLYCGIAWFKFLSKAQKSVIKSKIYGVLT